MARERPLIEIEDDIPLPKGLKIAYEEYPFTRMKKGDSFFIEGPSLKAVQNACRRAARENGKTGCRFVARLENNGVRCWRVS